MTTKNTLVAAVAAAVLAVAAPSAFAQSSQDAHERSAAVSQPADAVAYFRANELATAAAGSPGLRNGIENFRANELSTAARSGATARAYHDAAGRVNPSSASVDTSVTADSGSTIDWTQIGIGLGIGMLLSFGLLLAVRRMPNRPLTH